MSKFFRFLSFNYLAAILKQRRFVKKFRQRNLKIGLYCDIDNSVFGNNVYLGAKVVFVNSTIDNHSYISNRTEIRDTSIGKFCSIATDIKIVLGHHPTHLISLHPAFYANNKGFETFADKNYFEEYHKVVIGNDVWIGEGVVIPGGVTIGDGAIIAARSVVTKDVEPYSVIGGVPAKHIKYRFSEEERANLIRFKWWDKDDEWLKENYKFFLNSELFFSKIGK